MTADVKLCMGTHCAMMGNLNLYDVLEELVEKYPEDIKLEVVKCLNCCSDGKAPIVMIDNKIKYNARSEKIVSEILEVIGKNEGNVHSNNAF